MWISLQMPTKILGALPKNLGRKNKILDHFSATSALDTAYLLNEMSHRQTKMRLLIYNVYPKS